MMSFKHSISLSQRPHLVRSRRARSIKGESRYMLESWWSLLLFEYLADIRLDGRPYRIVPQSLILVPPGVEKQYHCQTGKGRHHFIHFRLRKVDSQLYSMSEFIPVTDGIKDIEKEFDYVIHADRQGDTLHAEVHLWHLLFHICSVVGQRQERDAIHPVALRARELLEENLCHPPALSELAARVGVSPNHLNALFKRCFAETVHACLSRLRMDQAGYLLRHSGHPIREIAANIGIPDLQAFNKAIKRHLGESPRTIRRMRTGPISQFAK